MIEIWEAKIEDEYTDELPMIIPIVIYHGKSNWNINATLGEMIKGYKSLPEDIQKHVPDYEYLLYDISRFTDEEIKGKVINKIAMTTIRDIFTKDTEGIIESVYKMIEYLVELEDKQSGIEYFETLMRYIFSARIDLTKEVANEIMNKIETTYPEGSEVVMTLAERFREEGMEEGEKKSMEKVVKKSIIKGLTTEDIMEITGLNKEEIEDIRKKMLS
ncbi:Rpn family recombination-promoting nuclease/putative transposase [Tissierella creatinophila]|uniref:Putative transposase n=1 Tax=Tissierella creatinophila DSM 6911 TaxID=1123403 RepID=A0A1U7M5L2_TISCR|nr:Rpn family recombination-promoting nuclease/putative transposase [Tissierella creatinophila]OLS02603.1 putative transposase [Tissierella creatinophila DSM 6911]